MSGKSTRTFSRYFPVAKRDRDWGLFVTTAGESSVAPGAPYPPEVHPKGYHFFTRSGRKLREYQLIYISGGTGWFKSEESLKTPISAGMVILLFPGSWHSYAPDPTTGWDEHWVGFNGLWPKQLESRGFFSREHPVLRLPAEDKMLELFREIMEWTRTDVPALQQALAGITVRLLSLVYCAQQSALVGDDREQSLARQAMNRLRENLDKPVDMAALSGDLGVSYRWLRRAFSRHTGLSPHHYLLQMRLARARDLLARTTLSTKEVALRVGFEDPQYFCRVFHLKVGMPPGNWRKSARE